MKYVISRILRAGFLCRISFQCRTHHSIGKNVWYIHFSRVLFWGLWAIITKKAWCRTLRSFHVLRPSHCPAPVTSKVEDPRLSIEKRGSLRLGILCSKHYTIHQQGLLHLLRSEVHPKVAKFQDFRTEAL